jgi:hypothetical protein
MIVVNPPNLYLKRLSGGITSEMRVEERHKRSARTDCYIWYTGTCGHPRPIGLQVGIGPRQIDKLISRSCVGQDILGRWSVRIDGVGVQVHTEYLSVHAPIAAEERQVSAVF